MNEKVEEAMGVLLRIVAATSEEASIVRYKRSIEHYADNLDQVYE